MAPKTINLHPPALPWRSPLLSLLSSIIGACFWLVVVCNFIDRQPPKVTVYFLFDFFLSNLSPPTFGCRPPTRSNPRAPPLQHPFYRDRQLLVDCCVLPRPPKATLYFKFNIFALNLLPPTIGHHPPIRSNPHTPPLKHPFYRGRQLLVDCCLLLINGGHLRPTHHILSIFWCGLFWCPKWEPASMASNNQVPCACPGSIGGGGTNRWCCPGCCHGDRGQSRLRVGWQWLILLLCVCCVLWVVLLAWALERRYLTIPIL